jgi:hypothetical protein
MGLKLKGKSMQTRSWAAIAMVLVLAKIAMAADPFVGMWKLNVAKSESLPGQEDKSQTLKIEAQENGLRFVIDAVNADGKPRHAEFVRTYGKEYQDNSIPGMTNTYTRVDANTVVAVRKKDGQELGRSVDAVSRDGKTMTRKMSGKNARGEETNTTVVYDKQ